MPPSSYRGKTFPILISHESRSPSPERDSCRRTGAFCRAAHPCCTSTREEISPGEKINVVSKNAHLKTDSFVQTSSLALNVTIMKNRDHPLMTSTAGGGGGTPKADEISDKLTETLRVTVTGMVQIS